MDNLAEKYPETVKRLKSLREEFLKGMEKN